jgi:Carbohydrate/starch-binding module (family 21)
MLLASIYSVVSQRIPTLVLRLLLRIFLAKRKARAAIEYTMPFVNPTTLSVETTTTANRKPRVLVTATDSRIDHQPLREAIGSHKRQSQHKSKSTVKPVQPHEPKAPLRSCLRHTAEQDEHASAKAPGKSVAFRESLEQIKVFSEKDVISPAKASTSHKFPSIATMLGSTTAASKRSARNILYSNLPNTKLTHSGKTQPLKAIFVEHAFYDTEKNAIFGIASVENVAFEKSVAVRYTFDDWVTIHETQAEFRQDDPMKDGSDHFVFGIDLSAIKSSRPISLSLCVKYNVNDRQFWDSNNNANYTIKLSAAAERPEERARSTTSLSHPPRSRHHPIAGEMPAQLESDVKLATELSLVDQPSARYDLQVALQQALSNANRTLPFRIPKSLEMSVMSLAESMAPQQPLHLTGH